MFCWRLLPGPKYSIHCPTKQYEFMVFVDPVPRPRQICIITWRGKCHVPSTYQHAEYVWSYHLLEENLNNCEVASALGSL